MQRYFRKFTMMIILLLAAGSCAEQSNETRTLADWSSPAGQNSVSPNLSLDLSGSPILSWMKVGENTVALEYSRWEGSRWSSPVTVAKGDNWLVNRADFPSVVQLTESLWASHWLVMTDPAIFAYDVVVSLSTDGGVTWDAPLTPHTDGTFSEHGFVSFFVNGEDIGAVWLDGREMVATHGLSMSADGAHGSAGGMTLRSTQIKSDGTLTKDQVIDSLVCDCCQTDIAQSDQGPVLVFRNRTKDEYRDIYFSRMIEGQWSEPKPVSVDGWKIAGCPVNGPSVATNDEATAVAWYTQAKSYGEVKLAVSGAGVDSFSDPLVVDEGDSVLGQVGLAATSNGGFLVSWMTFSEGTAGQLNLRYVDREGVASSVFEATKINMTRRAGLPQMVLFDNLAVTSWTGGGDTNKAVEVATTQFDTL